MSTALILTLVVAGAWLAAHVASEWLARRFLIISGAEYLVLGLLLGPRVGGFIDTSAVDAFTPLMILSLGWVGTMIGAQFPLAQLTRVPAALFRVGFGQALLTFLLVGGFALALLLGIAEIPIGEALLPSLALGAIGTASTPAGIGAAAATLRARGALVRQIEVATGVDALVAVVLFGLSTAVLNTAAVMAPRPPTPTEWGVIAIAIGVLSGILFHLFIGEEEQVDRLFIAMGGAVLLASGAAAHLGLSPLLPAALIGGILVNSARNAAAIRQVLIALERPLYFVLLIFAGAAWDPGIPGIGWVLILLFVPFRMLTRIVSARAAARLAGEQEALGPSWGRALVGQGGLAIAIGLNFALIAPGPVSGSVFTAAIVSVLFTDVFSARLTRTVLRNGGGGPA